MEGKVKFVNLGLPSGTLWADRNAGAQEVYQLGHLCTKAETTGQLPTCSQCEELIRECDFSTCYLANEEGHMVNCVCVTGPNGSRIFFPCTDKVDEANCSGMIASCCWTETQYGESFATFMLFQQRLLGIMNLSKIVNLSIGMTSVRTLKSARYVK